jgi:pyruvate kinase
MVEIRGREIRISHNVDKSGVLRVRSGSQVTMVSGQFEQASDASVFRINNEEIQRYLKPNDVAYFDDGKVVAIVTGITD